MAKNFDHIEFVHSFNTSLKQHFSTKDSKEQIVLFKNFDDEESVLTGTFDSQKLTMFLESNR